MDPHNLVRSSLGNFLIGLLNPPPPSVLKSPKFVLNLGRENPSQIFLYKDEVYAFLSKYFKNQ